MNTSQNNVPLACSLTDAELARRKAGLQQHLFSQSREITEAEDGYAFHFADEDELLARLMEYILAEKACCPFFRFDLTILAGGAGILWKVSGETGVKALLKAWLTEAGH